MNTNDKTPPIGTIEEDLSAEEKAIHEAEMKRIAEGKPAAKPTADSDLPKVRSDPGA